MSKEWNAYFCTSEIHMEILRTTEKYFSLDMYRDQRVKQKDRQFFFVLKNNETARDLSNFK